MTLTERFEARLSQFVASTGDDIILQTTPSDAAAVARQVERYVRAVCSEETRAEVLEHPEIVELWPALRDTGIVDLSPLRVGRPLRPRVLSARMGDGAWPLDVAPIDVIQALERIDDTEANLAAVSLREGRTVYPGTPGAPGENSKGNGSSYLAKIREVAVRGGAKAPALELHKGGKLDDDARLAEANAVGEWWPLAIAIVLHVERLVREPGALYAARRARKLVRERYGVHLAGLVRDAIPADGRTKEAAEELERATRAALERFTERLGADPATDAEALAERDGVLELDARFADFLAETCGEPGKTNAKPVRERGSERLAAYQRDRNAAALWAPWERLRATMLAVALWESSVREAVERKRRKPAALTYVVTSNVLDLHSRRYQPQSRDGQQALVFPEERGWVLVPSLSDGALASILERGVGLLTSQTGIDLLEWEVTEAHRQYTETGGASDFRHITIEGGWAALAHEKLGKQTRKAAEDVRAIVLAQAHLQFQDQGCRGNLLTYAEPRAEAPGRRSRVTITLGDMLLAGFVHQLREELGKTSLSSREARRLVPILGKTALVGRPNDYAAQRRMVWRFAMALRTQAPELAERGHVAMPLDTWATLAAEAGAPRSGDFLAKVQTAWEKGDERAGVEPLIVRVKGERDRYTLHESRKAALDFIVEGGRRTTKKRAEGKASARKRDHKVRHKKGAA